VYSGDLDIGALKSQLEIFKLLLKDANCICFYDMLVKIRELPGPEKKMIVILLPSVSLSGLTQQQARVQEDHFPLLEG
jgi:hypothetical protein